MKKLNNSGIAHHLLVLVLVVLAIAGGAGYLVWSRNNDKSASAAGLTDLYKIYSSDNGITVKACKTSLSAELEPGKVTKFFSIKYEIKNTSPAPAIRKVILTSYQNTSKLEGTSKSTTLTRGSTSTGTTFAYNNPTKTDKFEIKTLSGDNKLLGTPSMIPLDESNTKVLDCN